MERLFTRDAQAACDFSFSASILSCFPETDCDDMVWFRIRDHYDLVHEPGLLSEDRKYPSSLQACRSLISYSTST